MTDAPWFRAWAVGALRRNNRPRQDRSSPNALAQAELAVAAVDEMPPDVAVRVGDTLRNLRNRKGAP